jgi:pimeloyl-ACP methyl ester carboxylesterase
MMLRPAVLLLLCLGLCAGPLAADTPSADDSLARIPSHFASLDGVHIHYKDTGGGAEAVVFVHGWSCDLGFWRFQLAGMQGHWRAILVDLPGHGRSDKPEVPYTQELFARSLDAVLKDAQVERAVLVGHSNGTPVVRQFYRLFPAKTKGLVVVDGTLRMIFKDRAQFDAFVARFKGADYREQAARMIDGMTQTTQPGLREGIKGAMLATPQYVMASSFEGTGDPKLWEPDPIKVPLLVVLAKSPFWMADYEAFVRGLAPQVEYHVMEGVSHFLMMDKPDEFGALLNAFLKKTSLAAQ